MHDSNLHDANDDAKDAAQAALFRHHVADDDPDDPPTLVLRSLSDTPWEDFRREMAKLDEPPFPWWHMWNAGEAFQHPDNAGARENFVGPFETEAAALADNAAGPDEPLPFDAVADEDKLP